MAVCTSKRKFSPDTDSAGTLTLNFQCPQLCENKCQLFKPSTPQNKNYFCVGQPLEKAMAPYSRTLAWKIPWMEEPGAAVPGVTESDTTEQLHFHFSLSCIGEGNGNRLQCSCLENPRNTGSWWASIYGVAQNRTRLKRFSSSSSSRSAIKREIKV